MNESSNPEGGGSQQEDVERADDQAINFPKWRGEHGRRVQRFGEHVPFFFTRTGSAMPLEGNYRGAPAFLIANGPSLKAVDLSPLQDRWVMTVNNGARTFRGNANCTVDEPARFSLSMWLDPRITKFIPLAHFEKPLWDNRVLTNEEGQIVQRWGLSRLTPGDCPNVVGYRRNDQFHPQRWLKENTVNWGNHQRYGGGRSVLLASLRILYALGFRSVYLLGVDFEMSADKRYHFEEDRSPTSVKINMSTYAKMQQWLEQLQPHFLSAGFKVQNCNPESHLTAFPFISFAQALRESGGALGTIPLERTEGMYVSLEDRIKELKVGGKRITETVLSVGPLAQRGAV